MPPKNTSSPSAVAPRRSSRAPVPRAPYQPSAPSDKMKKTSAPKSVKRKTREPEDEEEDKEPALDDVQPAWKAKVAYPTLGPVPPQPGFRYPAAQVMPPPLYNPDSGHATRRNKPASINANQNIQAPAAQQPAIQQPPTAAQMARELKDTKRSRDNLVAVNADLRRQLERKDAELKSVTDAKYKDKELKEMSDKLEEAKQANIKLVVTNNEYHKKTKVAEGEVKKLKDKVEKLEDYKFKFKELGGEEKYLELVKEKYGMK